MVKAAVLYEVGSPLVIEDVELDDPKAGGAEDWGGVPQPNSGRAGR